MTEERIEVLQELQQLKNDDPDSYREAVGMGKRFERIINLNTED